MNVPDEKLPWFKFFPTDWLGDSQLQGTRASSRGVWANLISHMKKRGTGEIEFTVEKLQQLGACTIGEALLFLVDFHVEEAADVFVVGPDGSRSPFLCRSVVTVDVTATYAVVSRRLSREYRKKKLDRDRQDRKRGAETSPESREDFRQDVAEDDERLRVRERSEDQRSEIRKSADRAGARVDETGQDELHALSVALCAAWPNAGLHGLPSTTQMDVVAAELVGSGISADLACRTWAGMIQAWKSRGVVTKILPVKMAEHLRAGILQPVARGEVKLEQLASSGARQRPAPIEPPKYKSIDTLEDDLEANRKRHDAERAERDRQRQAAGGAK